VRRRRLLLAASVALSGVVLVPARADAPDVTGWWSAHRITPPNAGLPVSPPVEVQTPATVPPGGLYVAGGHVDAPETSQEPPPQRTAVSALRLSVGPRAALGDLELVFHTENGVKRAEGPVAVQACPSTIVWTPEEGGPLTSAPPFDCASGLAFGSADADDAGVRIPLGGLVRDGQLNIVLLPQPGSVFQAVFAEPGPDSIKVTRFPGPVAEPTTTTSTTAARTVPTTLPPRPRAPDPIAEILVSPPTTCASCLAAPQSPASGPSRRVLPPSRSIGATTPELSDWQKAMAAGVLAVLAALYVLLRGGRLPGVRRPAADTGPPARGIGRFARPRTGPNPRL